MRDVEATLTTVEKWIQRDDVGQLYDGDITALIKVIKPVLTVLLQYGRFPHQLAKHLLEQFAKNSCASFAAPFEPMIADYIKTHALEPKKLGSQLSSIANDHYNECMEVLEFAQQLYNQEVQAGSYAGKDEKPIDGSLNAFQGGRDDNWESEFKWYPPEEFGKFSASQKKKVRNMIKAKGAPPGAPEDFRQRFENAKGRGGYQRKDTWTSKPTGRNSKTAGSHFPR